MILDTGVLISVDRAEERARVLLAAVQRTEEPLHTSEAVVAQVWREGSRQARLAAVLKAVQVHPLDDGRAVGELLSMAGTRDVVDAHVVLLGAGLSQTVLTSDVEDLDVLAGTLGRAQPPITAW